LKAQARALIVTAPNQEFVMKKILLAGAAVLVLAGSGAVYAEHRPHHRHHDHARMNPEDRAAFADAKIAAVKAGLKLTPDQEKLWSPVEAAVRDFAKLRTDRANARMAERQNNGGDAKGPQAADPIARLQKHADDMAATAAALKKIAETADPLYKTLDDGQKRRLAILTHMDGGFGGGEGGRHRGPGRDDDGEHGHDRRGPGRFDGDHAPDPERL
jgi:LTXXQ motif family protein